MLETIAVILIILWLLGMVSGYTLGNFIYVLLVIAIVLFLVRLISGRRVRISSLVNSCTQKPAESITNSRRGESPGSCVMAKNGMP